MTQLKIIKRHSEPVHISFDRVNDSLQPLYRSQLHFTFLLYFHRTKEKKVNVLEKTCGQKVTLTYRQDFGYQKDLLQKTPSMLEKNNTKKSFRKK